jgi:internalin A
VPIIESWNRIIVWFSSHLPEVIADLNPPATMSELEYAQKMLGIELPQDLKDLYLIANGQKEQSYGVFFGYSFLSLGRMLEHWSMWKNLFVEDPQYGMDQVRTSVPPSTIKLQYINNAWIPFTIDGLLNHFGLDFDPDQDGIKGQIINFGRYANQKVLLTTSFADFLTWVANNLECGKGRVFDAAGMKIFDHVDLGGVNLEDGLVNIFHAQN